MSVGARSGPADDEPADDEPADARPAGRPSEEPPAARTFRLDLEYDGGGFCGWQRQASDRTVQGVVEDALARLLGAATSVMGAGRTDAGVHALHAVASFSASTRLTADAIGRALDALLPEDVGVLAVAERPGFHALRDARWKWYRYTWVLSRLRRVHERRTAWRVDAPLDVRAMEAAAATLAGTHDFAAFQSSGAPRASTVRTIAGVRLLSEPPRLFLDVVAEGYLYGMVRAIAGTLAEIGRGARSAASMADVLASHDRRVAGPAAPAQGLALVLVGFEGEKAPAFVDRGLMLSLESARGARDRSPRGSES